MARTSTVEEKLSALVHVVGLLNEVEAVLTGWVLRHDYDEIAKLTNALYELCDHYEIAP